MSGTLGFLTAGAFIVLTVVVIEQHSTDAAWGLVTLLLLGAAVSNPAVTAQLLSLVKGG